MSETEVDAAVLAERIAGLKELLQASLSAQEKQIAAALASQEKFNAMVAALAKEAVGKAESSQRAVNERQNEFRGQLSDQAATLMPRKEYEAAVLGLRELIDREVKLLRTDVASLRESRSAVTGQKDQGRWLVGVIIAAISIVTSVALSLLLQ